MDRTSEFKKAEFLKNFRRFFRLFILLLFVMIFQGFVKSAIAQDQDELFPTADGEFFPLLDVFVSTKGGGNAPSPALDSSGAFSLTINWDARAYAANLSGGNYFKVSLPDELILGSAPGNLDFPVYFLEEAVGSAHVDRGADGKGGVVTVTLNDRINDEFDVLGKIRFESRFNMDAVSNCFENTLTIASGPNSSSTTVIPYPSQEDADCSRVFKIPTMRTVADGEAFILWEIRLNTAQHAFGDNLVITDSLSVLPSTAEVRYIPGSFMLQEGTFSASNQPVFTPTAGAAPITDDPTFANDHRSFSYPIGNISGKSYLLSYQTTYPVGVDFTVSNEVKLSTVANVGGGWSSAKQFSTSNAAGTGQSHTAARIRILKRDADTLAPLEGAVFVVKRVGYTRTYTLMTDAAGEAVTPGVPAGNYTIQETIPPNGYRLDPTIYTFPLTAGQVFERTFDNRVTRADRSITVTKRWFGPRQPTVVVRLTANGIPVLGQEAMLDEFNGWTYTWQNLAVEDANGDEIQYGVIEDPIPGYHGVVRGTMDTGFTITNSPTEIPLPDTGFPTKTGP